MSVEDPVEMQRLADALPLERAASRWIVSNDPDEHVEKIGYYVGLGFKPSRVPRARSRPGALPDLYGEQVAAAAAQALRMMQTRSSCWPSPACRWSRRATTWRRSSRSGWRARAGVAAAGDVLALAQKIVSKAEGRSVELATRHALAARDRAGRRGPEGPAAGRADPVGIGARRALAAQRADRRASARLRHGQCRHRPVQCRRRGRRRARAAAAGRSRRQRRGAAGAARRDGRCVITDSFGRAWRRGTVGRRHRRGRPAGAARPARQSRPVRPHPAGQHHRLRRRDRGRRLAGDGPGRRRRSPSVLVRGLPGPRPPIPASELVRAGAEDLFR